MALVGEVTAAAPPSARWHVYCGARSKTRPGPKDARADRWRDAKRHIVGIEVIRSVARSSPKATVGSGRQDRKGHGDHLGKRPGLVVLCPSLGSHQQARTEDSAKVLFESQDRGLLFKSWDIFGSMRTRPDDIEKAKQALRRRQPLLDAQLEAMNCSTAPAAAAAAHRPEPMWQ